MFSHLALKTYKLANPISRQRLCFQFIRSAATQSEKSVDEPTAPARTSENDLLKDYSVIPFQEGPERDLVNFPRPVREMYSPKTRLLFIPDTWFQFFYKKTGVTGPYLFGAGLLTFLFSKEIWVIEHEFYSGISLLLVAIAGYKSFGKQIDEYLHKETDKDSQQYTDAKNESIKVLEESISEEKEEQWRFAGQKLTYDARRESIDVQREAEFRKRLMDVYQDVKRRLDFQLEMQNTKRQFEQKHMVDWIVNSVVKSITPQQEKEALQKCITDLKSLSAKA